MNMASAASHRLLCQISPRLISIMDPFLMSEIDEIRNFSTEVFVILFRRQNDKIFIEGNLDNSIMRKLNTLSSN
jgi:hypothetical protein